MNKVQRIKLILWMLKLNLNPDDELLCIVGKTCTRKALTCSGLLGSIRLRKIQEKIRGKTLQYQRGPCLLSALGYLLIGTMTISQIPQIFKILRKRSTLGVSFYGHLLLLQASSSTVAYAIYNKFPFSAWGEHIVLMFMFVVLVCLLLQYNKRSIASLVFMTVYILCMVLLLWPTVPPRLVQTLYLLSLPAMVLSRVLQMYKIHRTKCPGQLSATSSFLCIFHGLGRITTSVLTTGDRLMICAFAIGSLFNVLLFLQVMFYRRKAKKVA